MRKNYREWRQFRESYLSEHPLCADCQTRNVVTTAAEVDHRTPHKGDPALFWDRDNLIGLCKPCHSRKTASRDGGFGNKPGSGSSLATVFRGQASRSPQRSGDAAAGGDRPLDANVGESAPPPADAGG